MKIALDWATGLFEGEGSISLTPFKGRKNSWRVQMSLSSTDEDVVISFAECVGIGNVRGPYYKVSKLSKKPRWTWSIQTYEGCLSLCREMLPKLHSRRKARAQEMIELCERMTKQ